MSYTDGGSKTLTITRGLFHRLPTRRPRPTHTSNQPPTSAHTLGPTLAPCSMLLGTLRAMQQPLSSHTSMIMSRLPLNARPCQNHRPQSPISASPRPGIFHTLFAMPELHWKHRIVVPISRTIDWHLADNHADREQRSNRVTTAIPSS